MTPQTDELLFLALGGAGEIGMNLNLYRYRGKWLMVDLGITFADESLPGVDLITPDIGFIEGERKDLLALVLTHAHEDHLGAVPYLWERLKCPVYATPFAAAVLKRKLGDVGLDGVVPVTVVDYDRAIDIGPFSVTYLPITHSIPEGSALLIETAAGTVFHSGDWKLDTEPRIGDPTDQARLRQIGDEGVLALVCDSTNVFSEGEAGSEGSVRESLSRLFASLDGRIVVTTFSSNVARIKSVAEAAAEAGRNIVVAGRSLWRMIEAARSCGYLHELPPLLRDEEASHLPRDKVVVLSTGSQGEPRGAMARIAFGEHPFVRLEAGDAVIFSSKIIPGNERAIGRLCNRLVESGVEVLTERTHFVHVSGHPRREELRRIYELLRPAISVPVHGEAIHLAEHASFARGLGVPQAVTITNGAMLRLAPGPAEVVDHVPAGRLVIDDGILLSTDDQAIRTRRRIMYNGLIGVVLVLAPEGTAAAPIVRVSLYGIPMEPDEALEDELEAEIQAMVDRLPAPRRREAAELETAARRAVNRIVRDGSQKRPLVDVQVLYPQAGRQARAAVAAVK